MVSEQGGGITFHVYMRTCIISFIFLIAFLAFSALFYLWEFNFIQKRCVRQKRLFFSSKINFCCKLFFLKIILANEKLTKTLLILIKYNHFQTLYFSMILREKPEQPSTKNKLQLICLFYLINFLTSEFTQSLFNTIVIIIVT